MNGCLKTKRTREHGSADGRGLGRAIMGYTLHAGMRHGWRSDHCASRSSLIHRAKAARCAAHMQPQPAAALAMTVKPQVPQPAKT